MVASSNAAGSHDHSGRSGQLTSPVESSGSRDWSGIAERGSSFGIRLMLWWYRVFGRLLTLPVVFVVAAYFFLTDVAGRRASLAYLHRVYMTEVGREAFLRPPGLRESFRHYCTFAFAIVDRFSVWFDGPDRFDFDTQAERAPRKFRCPAAPGRADRRSRERVDVHRQREAHQPPLR